MRSFAKSCFVGLLGALSFTYLLNPTAGIFELIPDAIPIVGNLDEVTATTVLLASLAYFGIDLGGFLQRLGLGPRAKTKVVESAVDKAG